MDQEVLEQVAAGEIGQAMLRERLLPRKQPGEEEQKDRGGLSASALSFVRESILAGEEYADRHADLGILLSEYEHLRRRYADRVAADKTLREECPKLEAAARLAAEKAAEAKAAEPPVDEHFVQQFHRILHVVAHRRPTPAVLEFFAAFSLCYPDPALVAANKAKSAELAAADARRSAEQTLVQTAHVDPDPGESALVARLQTLEAAAAEARRDIQAAAGIPQQRDLVRSISAGQTKPDRGRYMQNANPAVVEREFLREARDRLARLNSINVPKAQATVERAEAEAEGVRKELQKLADERRSRCFRPEFMSWAID